MPRVSASPSCKTTKGNKQPTDADLDACLKKYRHVRKMYDSGNKMPGTNKRYPCVGMTKICRDYEVENGLSEYSIKNRTLSGFAYIKIMNSLLASQYIHCCRQLYQNRLQSSIWSSVSRTASNSAALARGKHTQISTCMWRSGGYQCGWSARQACRWSIYQRHHVWGWIS